MRMQNISLKDIRPSDGNPRSDFGDIDTLCRQIMATGGVPVNPIIAVKDGDVYRLVDGERRYRAMSLIHEADFEVPVIVADGWDEALSTVAALATGTSAKPLTAEEEQAGFQLSLLLGIDEQTQANALGCDLDTVKAARAKVAPIGWQGTIDQLVAANQFDGEDRDAILSAGASWKVVAHKVELKEERETGIKEARKVLLDLGVSEVSEVPENYDWALGVVDPDLLEMAGGWPEGTVFVDDVDRLSVYVPHKDDGASLRRAAGRMNEACASMQNAAIRFIVATWCEATSLPSVTLMRSVSRERRKLSFVDKDLSQAASMAARCSPSIWEVFTYLASQVVASVFVVDGSHIIVAREKDEVLDLIGLATGVGWQPTALQSELIDTLRR